MFKKEYPTAGIWEMPVLLATVIGTIWVVFGFANYPLAIVISIVGVIAMYLLETLDAPVFTSSTGYTYKNAERALSKTLAWYTVFVALLSAFVFTTSAFSQTDGAMTSKADKNNPIVVSDNKQLAPVHYKIGQAVRNSSGEVIGTYQGLDQLGLIIYQSNKDGRLYTADVQ